MAFSIKKPIKREKSNKSKSFYISRHNYSWENDKSDKMKVSLGNLSDAGWYWNGDEKDLNGFLFRLNHSKVKDEFLEDTKKQNVSFQQIKPSLKKAVENGDGLYEMSGDNAVWHFGEIDGDVDDSYELEEAGITDGKEVDKVYSEYHPINIDEFEKENLKSYKEDMKKAVDESNSFEELWGKQDDINQSLVEERMNANSLRFTQAIDKVKGKK